MSTPRCSHHTFALHATARNRPHAHADADPHTHADADAHADAETDAPSPAPCPPLHTPRPKIRLPNDSSTHQTKRTDLRRQSRRRTDLTTGCSEVDDLQGCVVGLCGARSAKNFGARRWVMMILRKL